jgi:hypothetical protein
VEHRPPPPLGEPRHVREHVLDAGREHEAPPDVPRAVVRGDREAVAQACGGGGRARVPTHRRVGAELRDGLGDDRGRVDAVAAEEPVGRRREAVPAAPGVDHEDAPTRARQLERRRQAGVAAADDEDIKFQGAFSGGGGRRTAG